MSYTTEENKELLEIIRKPDTYIRIQIWGYGSEMAWCPVSKKCADWWNEQKEQGDISPEEYMDDPEEFRKHNDIPQEVDFLWDSMSEQHMSWHESPGEECHFFGVTDESANITIEEVDSGEYNASIINTIIDGKDFHNAIDEDGIESSIDDADAVIPKGWYAQMISHEKGTFFDGILHLRGERFDPTKLVIDQTTMPNDEVIIQSVRYGEEGKEVEVDNQGGDTRGKGYSVYFYEETYEPPTKH